jgi:hypothetical protein
MARVSDMRREELKEVEKLAIAQGLSIMTFTVGPIFITIAAFGVYGAMGKPLPASVAFPAISLFNLLRFPILLLPMQILNVINCKVREAVLALLSDTGLSKLISAASLWVPSALQVSLKRLQDYLQLEEIKEIQHLPAAGNFTLRLCLPPCTTQRLTSRVFRVYLWCSGQVLESLLSSSRIAPADGLMMLPSP